MFLTAFTILSTCGRVPCSKFLAYGRGASHAVTLSTGASKKSKAGLSIIVAIISEPTPLYGYPSSTVTNLLVFITDLIIVSLSSGLILLKLTTSTEIPSFSNYSAALRLSPTILE